MKYLYTRFLFPFKFLSSLLFCVNVLVLLLLLTSCGMPVSLYFCLTLGNIFFSRFWLGQVNVMDTLRRLSRDIDIEVAMVKKVAMVFWMSVVICAAIGLLHLKTSLNYTGCYHFLGIDRCRNQQCSDSWHAALPVQLPSQIFQPSFLCKKKNQLFFCDKSISLCLLTHLL